MLRIREWSSTKVPCLTIYSTFSLAFNPESAWFSIPIYLETRLEPSNVARVSRGLALAAYVVIGPC